MDTPEGTREGSAGCRPTDVGIDIKTNRFGNFRLFLCEGTGGWCYQAGIRQLDDKGEPTGETLEPDDPDLTAAILRAVEDQPFADRVRRCAHYADWPGARQQQESYGNA